MRHIGRVNSIVLVIVLMLGYTLQAFSITTPNNDVFVVEAIFGIVSEDMNGNLRLKETDRIPNEPGTLYQWQINIRTDKKKVTWKEEFILPAPADVWGGEEKGNFKVSRDRKVSITEKTVAPRNGWITNAWGIAEGDPSGKYIMKIYVEGQLVKEFVFFIE